MQGCVQKEVVPRLSGPTLPSVLRWGLDAAVGSGGSPPEAGNARPLACGVQKPHHGVSVTGRRRKVEIFCHHAHRTNHRLG